MITEDEISKAVIYGRKSREDADSLEGQIGAVSNGQKQKELQIMIFLLMKVMQVQKIGLDRNSKKC